MSLAEGFRWSHQEWNFSGYSLAGITTSMFCRNASVCFDVGQGLPFQNSAKHILITHAHMDHAAGIPYLLSQKNMNGQKETNLYVPEALRDTLEQILKLWRSVDGHEYAYQLKAARPGELFEIDKLLSAKAFATPHRVPSQGYLLYQKKKRLKEVHRGASEDEIRRLIANGVEPNETVLEPKVAFTGDTKKEFLDSDPDIARAKILFVEVTFWDDAKPVEHARKWGHIHFDEFLEILPQLQNERIVLIHASVRYTTKTLMEILDRRLPPEYRERVVLFP
ncbi:MAG: MBL fold metallo-hydrolase, partial [Bdellovibrionota bacterium]